MHTTVVLFLLALLLASIAAAEPAPPPPDPSPTPPDPAASGFVALGRLDGVSRVGVDLTHLSNAGGGGHLFGGALFGRYVERRSGFGGYATLPFAIALGVKGSGLTLELSGAEVGLLYTRRLSASAALIAHAGFATAPFPDDVDYLPYAGVSSPADLVNSLPGSKLRLGVSPLIRSGKLVARFDVGAALLPQGVPRAAFTFGAGAGIAAERLRVMVEVTGGAGPSLATQATAWLTVRHDGGRLRPYAGLGTPVTQQRSLFPLLATIGLDVAL